MKRIMVVAGARPNFMKVGPLLREMMLHPEIENFFVHTGQHYDVQMSDTFLRRLCPKLPDAYFGATKDAHTHGQKMGIVHDSMTAVIGNFEPEVVVVVGDINSTLWAAMAAKKEGCKVAHVEAGLRSYDWAMEEEVNRVLVDSLSDYMFCTDNQAAMNCAVEESHDKRMVYMVGNIMADNLYWTIENFKTGLVATRDRIERPVPLKHILLTIHRPQNLEFSFFYDLFYALNELSEYEVTFPVHPRTSEFLKRARINPPENINIVSPMSYLDCVRHMARSSVVVTDSGGIQEETTMMGTPCLTLRNNTERPITVDKGTNVLYPAPRTVTGILEAILACIELGVWPNTKPPVPFWDGKTAKRIVNTLKEA